MRGLFGTTQINNNFIINLHIFSSKHPHYSKQPFSGFSCVSQLQYFCRTNALAEEEPSSLIHWKHPLEDQTVSVCSAHLASTLYLVYCLYLRLCQARLAGGGTVFTTCPLIRPCVSF